eukprot:1361038-Amorphochlora_amoeboformis.AAC.1
MEEGINAAGFGRAQLWMALITGFFQASDAMEVSDSIFRENVLMSCSVLNRMFVDPAHDDFVYRSYTSVRLGIIDCSSELPCHRGVFGDALWDVLLGNNGRQVR